MTTKYDRKTVLRLIASTEKNIGIWRCEIPEMQARLSDDIAYLYRLKARLDELS